jgi:hypothetical protein
MIRCMKSCLFLALCVAAARVADSRSRGMEFYTCRSPTCTILYPDQTNGYASVKMDCTTMNCGNCIIPTTSTSKLCECFFVNSGSCSLSDMTMNCQGSCGGKGLVQCYICKTACKGVAPCPPP